MKRPRDGRAPCVFAGTEPGLRVHPVVEEARNEVGIDLSHVVLRFFSDELAHESSLLVTMGCGEACLVLLGLRRMNWHLQDLKAKPIARERAIGDEATARVDALRADERWGRLSTRS